MPTGRILSVQRISRHFKHLTTLLDVKCGTDDAQSPRIRCIQGPFLLEFAHFARFAKLLTFAVFQGAVDFQTALPAMRSATGTDCSGCGHRALLLRPHMQRTLPRCSDRVSSAKALCLRRNGSLDSKLSDRSHGFWHTSAYIFSLPKSVAPEKVLSTSRANSSHVPA